MDIKTRIKRAKRYVRENGRGQYKTVRFVDMRTKVTGAHVVVEVHPSHVQISMNGKAEFTPDQFGQFVVAIEEAFEHIKDS